MKAVFLCCLLLALAVPGPGRAQNAVRPSGALSHSGVGVRPEDAPIEDIAPGETPAAGSPHSAGSSVLSPEDAPIADVAPPVSGPPHAGMGHQASPRRGEFSDAEIAAPAWWDIAASFQPAFMRQALLAGLAVGLLCGYLSVFVVLKRIAFVGVALAQVSAAGLALGFLLGFKPLLGAFVFMLGGVTLFAFSPNPRRLANESYIGAVYAVAGAAGVLFVAVNASGEGHMLDLLQGDILTGDAASLRWLLGVYAVLALAHAIFQKEWVLVSFDREGSTTLGFGARQWDFFLFLTVGIAIALAIRAVGALMTSALLILPGATALLLASRLRAAFWLAPLLTIVPVILGLHTSFVSSTNAPPSALIAAFAFVLFMLALLWRALSDRVGFMRAVKS